MRHDAPMLFADLATVSLAVADTRPRKRKAQLLGEALRGLDAGEVEPGVAYLSGELRQRRTGVGAEAALREGQEGLARFALQVGRPVGPMLASPSASLEEAMAKLGRAAVDFKLDGARIQVHRDGGHVVVASRSLDDLTARLP